MPATTEPLGAGFVWRGRVVGLALLALAIAVMGAVPACGDGGNDPGGSTVELVVYSAHGADILNEFARAFEAKHPGVEVLGLNLGAEEIHKRVRHEREHPQADVWWGGTAQTLNIAASEGLLEAYAPTWKDQVEPFEHHPQDAWYGHFRMPQCIAFNPKRLAPEDAPKRWDDLLAPPFAGKLIIRYPPQSGTMTTFFTAMIARQIAAGKTEAEGYAWLKRLDAATERYTANPTEMYETLKASPEPLVTVWNQTDIFFQAEEKGYPLAWVFPADGVPVVIDGIALIKNELGAERRKLAIAFYEFVTSLQAARSLMQTHRRLLTRKDIPAPDRPAWQRTLKYTPMPLDWQMLTDNQSRWMQHWDAEIKGTGK